MLKDLLLCHEAELYWEETLISCSNANIAAKSLYDGKYHFTKPNATLYLTLKLNAIFYKNCYF